MDCGVIYPTNLLLPQLMNANWSNLYFLNLVALLSNKSSSQEWKAFQFAISHVNSNKNLLPNTTVKAFEGDMDEENILEYGECLSCGLNNSFSVINLLTDTCTIMNMNHGMHVSIIRHFCWKRLTFGRNTYHEVRNRQFMNDTPGNTHREPNPQSLHSVLSWNVGIWISWWCQNNKTDNILLTKITKKFISSRR